MPKIYKNIITGFGGQLITIILGLVIPRLFITNYGSDANGLLSTITQIFTYMVLLEAGIGQAARNLLFKPFQKGNQKDISEIASIAKSYFRRFTIIYGIGVIALAFLLPFVLKTNVDSFTIALIVIFEGMSGVISFYFIQTPSIIIGVDGKSYINNGINLLNKIVGYTVKIVMAAYGLNIVLLQFVYFLVTVAKVFFYEIYFRKHYGWITFKKTDKNIKLKDRNSYILTEICWTIFSSTDMIVLSTFLSTQMSSVYGIYNMIFANITLLLNAVYSSVTYLLGQAYHESREKYIKMHDTFNSVFFGLLTSVMIVCYLLTIPFVSLYTKGVADVVYIYSSLPLMFCLVQLLSWSRYVSGNLIGVSGRMKQAIWVNVLESVINLTFSVILVQKFGIEGVLFGTVIALPIKLIYCNYVGDRIILNRSCFTSIKILGVNYIMFFGVVMFKPFFQISINSYSSFFFYGIILSVIFVTIVMGINALINPIIVGFAKKVIKRKTT
ncbi:MAG: polysaccharide biosynthesis C-terminal domain-containing protein [Erysipelotrichaceae bacterium]